MKSKHIQKFVISKLQSAEFSSKTFRDLKKGVFSDATVFMWCNMIRKTSNIQTSCLEVCPYISSTIKTDSKNEESLNT